MHCIENDGNNKNSGAGVFFKDGFLSSKKVREEMKRTGHCFHPNHFEKSIQKWNWKPAADT